MSMACPQCGSTAKCLDSRPSGEIAYATRRRYQCDKRKCGIRWSTVEQVIGLNQRGRSAVQMFTYVHRKAALESLMGHIKVMLVECELSNKKNAAAARKLAEAVGK